MISLDEDKARALAGLQRELRVLLAAGACKNVTREEIHRMVDRIYDDFPCQCGGNCEE